MMYETSYHNSHNLKGDTLKKADSKAKAQEDNAVAIFTRLWNQWITRYSFQREYKRVHDVWLKDGVASRILCNLEKNNGVLEKSNDAIYPGEFENKPVHAWKLRMADSLFGDTVNKRDDEGLQ